MRSFTAVNRSSKIQMVLETISLPPHVSNLADIHTNSVLNKAVLVCDGGIDHTSVALSRQLAEFIVTNVFTHCFLEIYKYLCYSKLLRVNVYLYN